MKRVAAAAIAIALAVGLNVAPAQAQSTKNDRLYLALVKSYSSMAKRGGNNRLLIKMGKQVCKTFDSGASLYEIVAGVMPTIDTKEGEDLFAATVAAAVVVYCPRHERKLD